MLASPRPKLESRIPGQSFPPARLSKNGGPIFEDSIFDWNDGLEAFVYPDQLPGLTIELIQSHERSWVYPADEIGRPISAAMNLVRLHHLGLVVADLKDACVRFRRAFGLEARDLRDDQGRSVGVLLVAVSRASLDGVRKSLLRKQPRNRWPKLRRKSRHRN